MENKKNFIFWADFAAIILFGMFLPLILTCAIIFNVILIADVEGSQEGAALAFFCTAAFLIYLFLYLWFAFKRVKLDDQKIELIRFGKVINTIFWSEVKEAGIGYVISKSSIFSQLYIIKGDKVLRRRYKNKLYLKYSRKDKKNIICFNWSAKGERALVECYDAQLKY